MLSKQDARDERASRAAELDRKRQEQQQDARDERASRAAEQQQEMLRRQHEHDREREDIRERARARELAEDLERKEHDREQRDHDRQLDRERAADHDRLLIETSAGIKQLHKDMANSPRFSRRGTPISAPGPAADARAADDRPKPAPCKTPTRACHTVPYQEADRHPGSAETTPPPRHVPVHIEFSRACTSTVDPPAPHTAARRGLAESFRPLGPPPHPPREVAPPRSSPPPVARITTHPTSQCRPPQNLTPPL